jgi:hypothetical protein
MAANTLSILKGKFIITKLGLWIDVHDQWVMKLKSVTTGQTSHRSYSDICHLFMASQTLMVDGGPEFNNKELKEECNKLNKQGATLEICPVYSPWVNGLLQGTNAILPDHLKQMCAPDSVCKSS